MRQSDELLFVEQVLAPGPYVLDGVVALVEELLGSLLPDTPDVRQQSDRSAAWVLLQVLQLAQRSGADDLLDSGLEGLPEALDAVELVHVVDAGQPLQKGAALLVVDGTELVTHLKVHGLQFVKCRGDVRVFVSLVCVVRLGRIDC